MIKNEAIEGQTFTLEEVVFNDCKLKNCHLFYSGGDFEWTNTSFENCVFHFRGAAKNTQIFFRTFGMMKEGTPPQSVKQSSQTIH